MAASQKTVDPAECEAQAYQAIALPPLPASISDGSISGCSKLPQRIALAVLSIPFLGACETEPHYVFCDAKDWN
jgi:hypothetical protein